MKLLSCITAISLLSISIAHAQSPMHDLNVALDIAETPIIIWQDEFETAANSRAKVQLLRQAWGYSLDASRSAADRQSWRAVWEYEYEREMSLKAMPNPFAAPIQPAWSMPSFACYTSGPVMNCE